MSNGIEIVVAHHERATLRVGDLFLKVDTDRERAGVEAGALVLAPVPTPRVVWHEPPVLAVAAVPGVALGNYGEPSAGSAADWAAAGAAVRRLHEAPLPPWPGRGPEELAARLEEECAWLLANGVLPADLVTVNRRAAETVLRPWTPVFAHGDLQPAHVFVDGGEVTGVIDWSEAGRGPGLYDLAVLTLGHPEHLGDVLAGYGAGVDVEAVRGWWSYRALIAVRWLVEHGYDPAAPGCELDVLRARLTRSCRPAPGSCG
ncbi:phosphotransferase [Kitasatospora sp. NPDC101183]|uniref:phosphotransferase n=1 Tax=Kitasatospora sp. NPDC101183 TaxID=3364100 RepID=UPI00381A1764